VAEVHVLVDGYVRGAEEPGDGGRVGSTVGFVRDGDALVVVDPGMVTSPRAILDPLAALGVAAGDVTDVVFSHHHPDHTLNAALFPNARFHDHWAIYRGDLWISREAEGADVSPGVHLLATPGHTPQDITTLVDTDQGVVAFTHLWWHADGPAEDPYAPDPAVLHRERGRVLERAAAIVPGHGPRFVPGRHTPR
jgi:glyoxylase-like metal-dependent hydrolase (beta-lactamase superfamily II)